ncbi:hypothetical protein GQ53DRAFT_751921 [Thozetella sp. PMI_491]|nr:hypothetical protein GQ53DRAFT_751921 [Thozetella sp. PMI_491]
MARAKGKSPVRTTGRMGGSLASEVGADASRLGVKDPSTGNAIVQSGLHACRTGY